MWAEEAVVKTPSGTTALTGTIKRGTYVRNPRQRCWRFVPRDASQALSDLRKPVIAGPGELKPPQQSHWHRWLIDVVQSGHTVERIIVDRRTLRVLAISTAQPHALFFFETPSKEPALTQPKPRC